MSGPDRGLFINHPLPGNRHSELSVTSFVIFLEQSGQSPWLFPCDPLQWVAGPEHSEAGVHLKPGLEGTRAFGTESKWKCLNIHLADRLHPSSCDRSFTGRGHWTEWPVNLTFCFWAPETCDVDFLGHLIRWPSSSLPWTLEFDPMLNTFSLHMFLMALASISAICMA